MKFWLIAIWRFIPTKWVIVSAPFILLIFAFLGWFLFGGLFIEKVDPRVVAATERLQQNLPRAERGDPEAQFAIGVIYRDGLTGAANPRAAAKWLERAARQGHAPAQLAIGRLYAAGSGVAQNFARAAGWYRNAAVRSGYDVAQYALGALYFNGRGVENDFGAAVDWFKKAAMQGHAGAQSVLGAMYEKGWGIDRDLVSAYVWFSLAARQAAKAMAYRADIDPGKELEKLKTRISRLQLKKGSQRLRVLRRRIADR